MMQGRSPGRRRSSGLDAALSSAGHYAGCILADDAIKCISHLDRRRRIPAEQFEQVRRLVKWRDRARS